MIISTIQLNLLKSKRTFKTIKYNNNRRKFTNNSKKSIINILEENSCPDLLYFIKLKNFFDSDEFDLKKNSLLDIQQELSKFSNVLATKKITNFYSLQMLNKRFLDFIDEKKHPLKSKNIKYLNKFLKNCSNILKITTIDTLSVMVFYRLCSILLNNSLFESGGITYGTCILKLVDTLVYNCVHIVFQDGLKNKDNIPSIFKTCDGTILNNEFFNYIKKKQKVDIPEKEFRDFVLLFLTILEDDLNFISTEISKTTEWCSGGKSQAKNLKTIKFNSLESIPVTDFGLTNLPMVIPPIPWKLNNNGGGLISNNLGIGFLFLKKSNNLSEFTFKNERTLTVINKVQEIPFTINITLLEFLKTNMLSLNKVGILENLFSETFEIFREKVDSKFELKVDKVQKDFLNKKSKACKQNRTLVIAEIFSRFFEIFFTVYVDFRGRLFRACNTLNLQGSDLEKALLKFKNPIRLDKSFEIEEWLYLGACNYLGSDKINTTEYGANFILDNSHKIINLFNNNLTEDSLNFLKQAKDVFLFLAFSIEFYQYSIENNKEYVYNSYLNSIDASQSANQIISCITKNFRTAFLTNLISKNNKNDFYFYYLGVVKDYITGFYKTFKESSSKNKKILLISELEIVHIINNLDKITRKEVKIAFMAGLNYGMTRFTYLEHLMDSKLSTIFNKNQLIFISKSVYEVLKTSPDFKNEFSFFSFLKYVCKKSKEIKHTTMFIKENSDLSKLNKSKRYLEIFNPPIFLDFNSLFTVSILYAKQVEKTHDFRVLNRRKFLRILSIEKVEYFDSHGNVHNGVVKDFLKTSTGIQANFTHYLDASILYLVLEKCFKQNPNINISTIHDCFCSSVNNIPLIRDAYKSVFIDLFEDPSKLIKKFYKDNLGMDLTEDEINTFLNQNFVNTEDNSIVDFKEALKNSKYFLS